ncbi:hypothetical protein [Nocardia asiatica]|uniref:hypothetical protein n=1 Tax=Nocardia asiatica TaxID=209252 RepID=UPI0002D36249|nr:hypothetical protein [Nocardia asiatica]
MKLYVDARNVPPTVELREPEDFKALKVVLATSSHIWVEPENLATLAGKVDDSAWQSELRKMIDYASSKGWVDDEGRVRVHVEVRPEQ